MRINKFGRRDDESAMHTTLLGEDGLPIADLFTVKSLKLQA